MDIEVAIIGGFYANGTRHQARGRLYDGNHVRKTRRSDGSPDETVKPIGGWRPRAASTMTGAARAMLTWITAAGVRWIAVGTHSHLYVQSEAGNLTDITPNRATATLAANPFSTAGGSAVVTVTHAAHGAQTGARVTLGGAAAVGGITPAGTYLLTRVDANTYTITHGAAATSTAVGGGAAVSAAYSINPGRPDATLGGAGYGMGLYGSKTYGAPRSDLTRTLEASVWSLDLRGDRLVAVHPDDGQIVSWDNNTASKAVKIPNSPAAKALFVMPDGDGVIVALNGRSVAWCDRDNSTVWAATALNKAGDITLQTLGSTLCGRAVGGRGLILTDTDAWLMERRDGLYVYGFEKLENGCGAVSRGGISVVGGGRALWFGLDGMWSYDGLVRRVDCEVQERVWGALTSSQASKVTSFYNSAHDEAWFFYPSGGSTENDRYVHVNVLTGYWFTGALDRTCACDKGVFRYPMAVCTSRHVHEHEVPGGGYGATAPYVLTGPYELDAERRVLVSRVYPDSLGNGTLTFYGQDTPKEEPVMLGTYAAGARTDLLFSAQEVSMRYDFTASTDRMGTFRVMARPQGRF